MMFSISKWWSAFILGALGGAVGINLLVGFQLDKAYMEMRDLRNQTTEQQAQIELLRAENANRRPSLVKELHIHILCEDKFLQEELEHSSKTLLADLIGKEVASLDPILVSNVLNNRVLETENSFYRLKVKAILVSEKIILYIEPVEEESN